MIGFRSTPSLSDNKGVPGIRPSISPDRSCSRKCATTCSDGDWMFKRPMPKNLTGNGQVSSINLSGYRRLGTLDSC